MKKWKAEESANDKKQLPLKILGNSFFGSYGAENLFPWGSKVCAERTTCSGRMMLRLMIYHFNNLGYKPVVGDTDGFNFKLPAKYRYNDTNPYIGKGLNRNVTEGKEYTGFNADVAEFNDLYMRGKNGLGIDEIVNSTINFLDFFNETFGIPIEPRNLDANTGVSRKRFNSFTNFSADVIPQPSKSLRSSTSSSNVCGIISRPCPPYDFILLRISIIVSSLISRAPILSKKFATIPA